MRIAATIAAVAGKGGYFLICIFVISVALVLTASRGGVIASVAGVVVLGILIGLRRSTGKIGVLVIAVSLVALVLAFSIFGDLFGERLGATPELKLDDSSGDRISVYAVTSQSILDAPWAGFGYGTFADIFPLYRNSNIGIVGTWDKAHNTYLELLQGLGVPVALVLFASIAWMIATCLRGALTRKRVATPALVAVAASAIVLLHSLIDFSLQIQAITLTWCALLGTGLAQAMPGTLPSQEA